MKKLFITLAITISILGLTGCGSNTIVGKWSYGSFVYTFNSNKTCTYEAAGSKMECTYEVDGDKLSILYKGNTVPFETTYKIEGKTLHIMDSFGADTAYTRK